MTIVACSMTRVESQTAPEINERIRRQTLANVDDYKVRGESLSKAFGWFVVVLALVIGGFVAAGVRTTSLTS